MLITTALAWLGLAGLSDAIIEWQHWFEQGVFQHWRSVKEWTIAVLLWWVPFKIPSVAIDYLVVGAIVVRAIPPRNWAIPDDTHPVSRWFDVFLSNLFLDLPQRIFLVLIWPVVIINSLAMIILDFPHDPDEKKPRVRRHYMIWVRKMGVYFLGFIPFLFAVSTLLYDFG